ncbi:hypothetical protein CEUSTIGMA_g3780.t1 [Chlamydomonas eustigma]|uniref:Uncharacterized protein n=1 Tax=Chlamydomonas eustigma TaxID=1157962 RepID=A0A250WZR1_9CHLO|nr:hypothetical protein CEUSTIGMA_g3780.t1 [Chlamydomonas eustigma]|eukprot:GAX76334.1 hypothetical protein CEUSTIGMA_g3780.t1 [Chlamydomonas eustigma]
MMSQQHPPRRLLIIHEDCQTEHFVLCHTVHIRRRNGEIVRSLHPPRMSSRSASADVKRQQQLRRQQRCCRKTDVRADSRAERQTSTTKAETTTQTEKQTDESSSSSSE